MQIITGALYVQNYKNQRLKSWLLLEITTIEEIISGEMIDHLNLMVIEVSIITTSQIILMRSATSTMKSSKKKAKELKNMRAIQSLTHFNEGAR